MRRRRALRAEIVLRIDDALSEIALPDAVDGDARGERIVAADQPMRQVEAGRAALDLEAAAARPGTPGSTSTPWRRKSPLN